MNYVTPRDVWTYRRDGIVKIERAFSPQWVQELTAAFDRVLEAAGKPNSGASVQLSGRASLKVVRDSFGDLMVIGLPAHDPTFQRWIETSPAAQICAELTGSSTMRFWIDASFQKDTTSDTNGTPWHNDYCTWPFWGEQLPILWMALTDVGPDDAPLRTLLGSHRDLHRYYSWLSPAGLECNAMYHPWQELLDKVAAPGAKIATWEVKAGDCLVMHPKMIHSSLPRTTAQPGRRLSFSTRWLGDDAIFAPDAFTPSGDMVGGRCDMIVNAPPSNEAFPVIWRKNDELAQVV